MNRPPADAVSLPADDLRAWLADLFAAVPVPRADAELIAELMVDTDLRGVVSHGIVQVERYVQGWREGRTNREPVIEVLREGPATAALNGDGGLGYLVAARAMEMVLAKADEIGVGVVTTTYHDHVGSTGKYVRMALRSGHVGIALSGRSAAPAYDPDASVLASIQGSPPFTVGVPGGADGPPFLLDMSTALHWDEAVFARQPQAYIKAMGIAHVANLLSGTLGGQMLPAFDRRRIRYASADQSGFFLALAVDRFTDPQALRDDVDRLVAGAAGMQPLPGLERAELPGGPEWRNEARYRTEGIPVGAETLATLARLGDELGVPAFW